MLTPGSVQWTRPNTWGWFVYVWLAFLIAGAVKPLWRWYQRVRVEEWPLTSGRIEFAEVSVPPSVNDWIKKGSSSLQAELYYSYSVEGKTYTAMYARECNSDEEAREFIRDLEGKSASVSYNPHDPSKSILTTEAINSLLATRASLPETSHQPFAASDVPDWAKPLLLPLIALSLSGLALSLWVHIEALAVHKVATEALFAILHMGVFIVWFPAIFIAQKRVGNLKRKDLWKVIFSGAPDWISYAFYGFSGYAAVTSLLSMFQTGQGPSHGVTTITEREFSTVWMVFYFAAFAIFYSALLSLKSGSRSDLH